MTQKRKPHLKVGEEPRPSKAKRESQPTQVNPKGTRVKVMYGTGKIRWDWQ